MLVTGRPLVVLGTITAPPGPVYAVMVMEPLLVVKLNWARTTVGSANSSSSGSSGSSLVAQAVIKRMASVFGRGGLAVLESCLLTHRPFIDPTWVRGNWLPVALIVAACCQARWRVSTSKSCDPKVS